MARERVIDSASLSSANSAARQALVLFFVGHVIGLTLYLEIVMIDDFVTEIIESWDMEAPDVLPAGSVRQEEIVKDIFFGFPSTYFRCDDYVDCPF